MNKNRFLYVSLAFMLLFSACKKKDDITVPLAKIKTITPLTGSSQTFTYNADGRVSMVQYSTGEYINYTYTTGMVTYQFYNMAGTLSNTISYILNAEGKADSVINSTTSYKCAYDADGYEVFRKMYSNTNTLTGTRYWVVENGNVTEFHNISAGGQSLQNWTYYFDTDHINTTGNSNMGIDFLGTQSKNATKSLFDFSPPDNGYWSTYQNEFDSQGRTTSTTYYNTSGVITNKLTFTYY